MATEIMNSAVDENQRSADGRSIAEQSAKPSDEISLLDLIIILLERKRLIIWLTAACAVTAVIVSFLLPKSYTATVALLPPQQSSSMASALSSQLGSLSGMAGLGGASLGLKNPNDVFVGMLKSRTVEDAMVQNFRLMQEYHARNMTDARLAFEHHADVDGDAKDRMIHISIEDHDPGRAAELANGYVDQFRKLSEHLAITEAAQRRLFFEQQLEQAKDNLANAEEALKQTEQSTGLIELSGQARALIESAAALRAQIAAKEVQIQGIQTYATGQNSEVVQAQQELDSLRMQLAKLGGSESAAGLNFPKGTVPNASLEYIRKVRDVKYYETIFDILARQFEIAKLDEAKQGALVQVVDPAIAPDKRSYPKRGLIIIGGTVLGLLAGITFAFASAGIAYLKTKRAESAKFQNLKRLLAWRAGPESRTG